MCVCARACACECVFGGGQGQACLEWFIIELEGTDTSTVSHGTWPPGSLWPCWLQGVMPRQNRFCFAHVKVTWPRKFMHGAYIHSTHVNTHKHTLKEQWDFFLTRKKHINNIFCNLKMNLNLCLTGKARICQQRKKKRKCILGHSFEV